MITKQALRLGAASILASLASVSAHAYAPSDDGLNRGVEIINDSPYAIVKLEAKNVGDVGSWHTYLNRVRPGRSSMVEIDDGQGYCRFDLLLRSQSFVGY